MTGVERSGGDDVVIQVRVRRANLPALQDGVQLGVDSLTGGAIELQLVQRDDGVHDLLVVTNAAMMLATPDPVEPTEWHGFPVHVDDTLPPDAIGVENRCGAVEPNQSAANAAVCDRPAGHKDRWHSGPACGPAAAERPGRHMWMLVESGDL